MSYDNWKSTDVQAEEEAALEVFYDDFCDRDGDIDLVINDTELHQLLCDARCDNDYSLFHAKWNELIDKAVKAEIEDAKHG